VPRAAAASEVHVAQAALDALRRGNATDAIVAGVLVAAAASPAVLLGPIQILAGGTGTGLLAIDGRVRQPGLAAPRPRGFLATDRVPEAAYIGASALPAALAVALGSLGTSAMQRALGPAISWARANAPERLIALNALARKGALGLTEEPIAVELLAIGGRAVGGLLTRDDLSTVRPTVERRTERSLGTSGVFRVPCSTEESPEPRCVQVLATCDSRGRVAIACYETSDDAVPIPALGLAAPRHAAPVMRGKRRAAPGTPCMAAAPMGLRVRSGAVEAAVGIARARNGEAALEEVFEALDASISTGHALAKATGGYPVVLAALQAPTRVIARS
jgi:hypothetical protein